LNHIILIRSEAVVHERPLVEVLPILLVEFRLALPLVLVLEVLREVLRRGLVDVASRLLRLDQLLDLLVRQTLKGIEVVVVLLVLLLVLLQIQVELLELVLEVLLLELELLLLLREVLLVALVLLELVVLVLRGVRLPIRLRRVVLLPEHVLLKLLLLELHILEELVIFLRVEPVGLFLLRTHQQSVLL